MFHLRAGRQGSIFDRAFWRSYSIVYDSLTALAPYRAMLEGVADKALENNPENILDVGTGTGNVLAVVLRDGRIARSRCFGVDNNQGMLARAKRKLPGCKITQGSATSLRFSNESFDVVVASNVLYTVDPTLAVSEMFRVLRPGGRLIITTPCHDPDTRSIIRAHVRNRGLASLLRRLPPLLLVWVLNVRIVHNANYHFYTEAELRALLGPCSISLTYADQAWFAVAQKKGVA